jgi:hypothetical protein
MFVARMIFLQTNIGYLIPILEKTIVYTGRKFIIPVHKHKIKAVYVRIFLKEQE